MLGHSAVHGAFAGYSGFVAGVCNRHYTFLPCADVVRAPRKIDPKGRLFRMMRACLGQPDFGEDADVWDGVTADCDGGDEESQEQLESTL
jgi:6-phosphofructokinase 1